MKYINLIVLVLVVFVSQYLVSGTGLVSVETHNSMQMEIRDIIEKALQDNVPGMYDFKLLQIQSEAVDQDNVKVNFSYSFRTSDVMEGASKTENSGHVLLKRLDDRQWSFEMAQIEDQKIEFSDPIVIQPEGTELLNPVDSEQPTEPQETITE